MRQIQVRSKASIFRSITLVALLLFILLMSNQWRIFSIAQKDLKEEKAVMESLKLKQETTDKLKEDKDLLMDKLEALQYMIPSDKDHADILGYLQSIFMEHNVQVIQLQFDDYVRQDGYDEIPISISLKAQYSQIIDFLKDLRVGSRPFRVDEFYIDGEDNDNSTVYCDILVYGFFKAVAE